MEKIKNEAKTIIAYARYKYKKPRLALKVLDLIMNGDNSKLNQTEQSIAEFISDKTSYTLAEKDYDVDVESGDWGIPVIVGGGGTPIGITIEDKDNLIILRREVDNILNKTSKKISDFVSSKDKPKWKCQKCDRFFKKELSSVNEIQALLDDFSIGKYWSCRSCKTKNYFCIGSKGVEFKTHS
ncbi:MAG: hypothetical protein NTX96_00795 [Candidatus Zambryskibacteria bacterium]|nr:hypothetical protein [Candidatus Zambryskibacteria bacterium]